MAEKNIIQPRTLRGFRDYLPEAMMPREQLIDIAKQVYRSYGFAPIDTPTLEYQEILDGKGSEETDRQMYRFQDHGGRNVGMRFDLTVPLARFAAQHIHDLGTPFKRYHIATVWRGENTQRGRYREFMQCDFDTIGTQSIASDIEVVLVIHDLLQQIGFRRFTIHINNRKILNGLLQNLGLADRGAAVLRALDKLAKVGRDRVVEEMTQTAGASIQQANQVLDFAQLQGDNQQILKQIEPMVAGNELGMQGYQDLDQLVRAVSAAGVEPGNVRVDVSIARGLEYYTGTIYETFLDDLPEIGSICSGGRYDNLAELYTKQQLPGVGASLGLDRLLAAMEELKMISKVRTPAPVLIPYFASERLHDYLHLATKLRKAGIGVEVYPEPKKLGQQLKYADRRGFKVALIAGQQEFDEGQLQVKDLQTGESQSIPLDHDASQVIEVLCPMLAAEPDPATTVGEGQGE